METYTDFWPYYLGQHSKRSARLLHVAGTLLALLALFMGIFSLSILWLLAAPVIGYGFAFAAHSLIENNKPATFAHPLWSLRGDLHMLILWLTGRLEAELVRNKLLT